MEPSKRRSTGDASNQRKKARIGGANVKRSTSGTANGETSQIGGESSPTPVFTSVSSVIAQLRDLDFTTGSQPDKVVNEVGATIIRSMKPGRCLIGNKEEEAEFHRPKPPPPEGTLLQANAEVADEQIDVKMETEAEEREKAAVVDAEPAELDVQPEADEAADVDSDEEIGEGDFLEYAASNKKPGEDVEEELGHYEKPSYGDDWILLPSNNQKIQTWEYFGSQDWTARIEKLYSIQAMPCPEGMTIEPRDFQLKAAAQGLYCVNGPYKLFLLGDEMGVGKTLTCVLMMWALRKQPGMCIVLCPKSLCQNWIETIEGAWEGKHGLRAFMVDNSSITQAQLLAGGYDVLVCSYEFFAANGKENNWKTKLETRVMLYANDQERTTPRPTRPVSALQSEMWKILGMPFKVAFLDEAQKVSKPGQFRHDSIKNGLAADSFAIISGTLPHNKWYDMFGHIDFGRNHPFDTVSKFLHCFSDFDATHSIQGPSEAKLRLLQKFLQPMLVARPASILRLKDCEKNLVPYELKEAELPKVVFLAKEYARIAGMNSDAQAENGGVNLKVKQVGAFGKAVKAQMAAFHPMIAAEIDDINLLEEDQDLDYAEGMQNVVIEEYGTERDLWLGRVKARPNIIEESGRVAHLMKLYEWAQVKYPGEKMIIFSASLKFLDIVAEAFSRKHNIVPVRFDGSVPVSKRRAVEVAFQNCPSNIPLLITMNAGGVGLNIQHASKVVICEPQWNRNAESQAISRAYRQGQEKIVKAWSMLAVNSEIEPMVLEVQMRKTGVNEALMRPLIRKPNEKPADIRLLNWPGLRPINDFE